MLEAFLLGLSCLLCVPAGVLFVECMVSLVHRKRAEPSADRSAPSTTILVPAHEEELVIRKTLSAIRRQMGPGDRIIVVADNCTDRTAQLARESGAEVLEREDSDRRGKGHAVAHGIRALEQAPPEVVVLVDADCSVEEGGVRRIARWARAFGRPIQARYLMELPEAAGPRDHVSKLAVVVRNLVRPRALANLGLPCHLLGSGMAWPWSTLSSWTMDTDSIVEDMEWGIDAALAGTAPMYCEGVGVTGRLPERGSDARAQRRRWEHGHLRTILRRSPLLLWRGLATRRLGLIALALDLAVPPISLLVLLMGCGIAAGVVLGLATGIWLPCFVFAGSTLAVVLGILACWLVYVRRYCSLKSLLYAPAYVVWQIPILLSFFLRPQVRWVKTGRDRESQSA